uniref:Uncharacterized protein n=1 Tax=Anopheles coluzzii TaxID=1518534 RepID=A0A6E8VVV9_ANOCL
EVRCRVFFVLFVCGGELCCVLLCGGWFVFPNPLISSAGALFSGRKQYETHAHTYTQLTTNTHAYPAAAARRHSGRILELFVCVCVCLCVCASVPVSVVLARRRRRVCKCGVHVQHKWLVGVGRCR